MSHQINKMAFAGELPWHRLGTKLPGNSDWETIRPLCDFYEAEEREMYIPGMLTPVPDRKALVRADNGSYLATVGHQYQVLQFRELAEAGVKASGEHKAIWHTAGTLGKNGIRGWLLGELPNPIKVKGDESEIRKYILLSTAHDGGTAATLSNVATRVVCANTLGSALREEGSRWRIHHGRNAQARLEEATKAFRRVVHGYDALGDLANWLVDQKFTTPMVQAFNSKLFPIAEDAEQKERATIIDQRTKVAELAEFGTGVGPAMRGTAWSWFQGFTEWADHHQAQRKTANAGERRLESIWMGSAAAKKGDALQIIRELVTA